MNSYKLLKYYFEPNLLMRRRHRKAAKKRRILKKWIKRFGADVNLKTLIEEQDAYRAAGGKTIWDALKDGAHSEFDGGTYMVPLR